MSSLTLHPSPLTLQIHQYHHSRIKIPKFRSNITINPSIPIFQNPRKQLSRSRIYRIRSIQQNHGESPPMTLKPASTKLESLLSTLASLYPVYVTVGGVVACLKPSTFSWFVERGPKSYSYSLGFIMLAMGLTLEFKDLVTLIAQGDVPLSIVMTVVSTLAAVLLTPLLTMVLAGTYVHVDAIKLSLSTLQVVVAPVLVGSYLQSTFPWAVKAALPFAPLLAVLVSSLLACSVFSENVGRLKSSMVLTSLSSDTSHLLYARDFLSSEMGMVVISVLLLHFAGFFVGYVAATVAGFKEHQRRAISIEVGMQNSSLGVVLAAAHFSSGIVALPPAVSAVIMNIMGSSLGFFWKCVDPSESKD